MDARKLAREFFGLFLLFWGLIVLLSLLTYSQSDPSLNHVVSGSAQVSNRGGLFGAFISGLLVDIFGFAAFVWPLFFIAWGLGCVTSFVKLPWWRWVGFFLLAVCLLSLGAAWDLGIGDVRGGGVLGNLLHTWCTRLFSPAGSSLIWLFALFISLELSFGIPWMELLRKSTTLVSLDALRTVPGRMRERARSAMPSIDLKKFSKLSLPNGQAKLEAAQAASELVIDLDMVMEPGPGKPKTAEPDRSQSGMDMFGRLPDPPAQERVTPKDLLAGDVSSEEVAPLKTKVDPRPVQPSMDVEEEEAKPSAAHGGFVFREGPIATADYAPDTEEEESFNFEEAPRPVIVYGAPPPDSRTDFRDVSDIAEFGRPSSTSSDASAREEFPMYDSLSLEDIEPPMHLFGPIPPVAQAEDTENEVREPVARKAEEAVAVPLKSDSYARELELVGAADLTYRPAWAEGDQMHSGPSLHTADDLPPHVTAQPPQEMRESRFDAPSTRDVPPTPSVSTSGLEAGYAAQEAYAPEQVASQPSPDSWDEPASRYEDAVQPESVQIAAPFVPSAPSEPSRPAQPPRRARPVMPSLDLLSVSEPVPGAPPSRDILAAKGEKLMACLADFGIQGEMAYITPGPVISMFELRPAPGVKVSRILNLSDDLALALKALAVRIQAPVPGSDTVGVEIPNEVRAIVNFRELLEDETFSESTAPLNMALGKDIGGHPFAADLSRMPHLLVAGATGAGKSVCLNSILLSFLYKCPPNDLRLLLVDPKRIELAVYADLPHLVHPVVTEVQLAKNALAWAVSEMDARYDAMARMGVRNIAGYNKKIEEFGDSPPAGFEDLRRLPFLVIIIDELSDLMMTAGKEIEAHIVRLAQLARAAGIHLIVATQRPSVDVVTGLIKANFPCRISFQVSSKHDSRTILDTVGAEHLLGKGDMLFKPSGGKLQRLHGAFVSDEEVVSVVEHWKRQQPPDYAIDFSEWGNEGSAGQSIAPGNGSDVAGEDSLYAEVIDFVRDQGKVSISLIQRRFRIGFNKAARFVEQMEQDGVIQPGDRQNKARQVIRD